MKAEQAYSVGRDPVPLWRDLRTAPRRIPPLVWLNLVCLDAPLVAIAWLWLFARTFHIPLQLGNGLALFLTAWLIYLADRFADAIALGPGLPRSLRQEFCLGHREIWITTLALVAGFDAYVIWRTTALQTFVVGAVVGLLALLYLVANYPFGLIWRSLPAKELAIGILFAAGTVVAVLPHPVLTPGFTITVLTFAALCSLNCISIAVWERDLDRAQGKVSIATVHPGVIRRVGHLCLGLAGASVVLAILSRSGAAFFACVGASALLLACLNRSSSFLAVVATALGRRKHAFVRRLSAVATTNDQRTALADLVLLTPVIFIILAAL